MSKPSNPPNAPTEDSRPLVFAVDDEPMLLELASLILTPLGFHVRTFRDPDSAVRAFAEQRPPPVLILTDYAMHHLNGLDLIRECRRIHPKQKIIMVSGTVDESIYRNVPDKPNRFLAKPYNAKQLADLVREVLG